MRIVACCLLPFQLVIQPSSHAAFVFICPFDRNWDLSWTALVTGMQSSECRWNEHLTFPYTFTAPLLFFASITVFAAELICYQKYRLSHFQSVLFFRGWFLVHPIRLDGRHCTRVLPFWARRFLPFLYCDYIRWFRFEVVLTTLLY
jgi:hypothetical protein